MVARGPDGSGCWISEDKSVGIAHRRLAIIDLSDAASQPMSTPDGKIRVVFNGEIYNYQSIRNTLKGKGYRFQTDSDTEVLLNLYDYKGTEMVHDLRGMYAFAIWDEKKQGVFLVRDPFGIKPLYYADDGYTIRACSQVKALIKADSINTALEPAGHVGFFLWGHVPEPYTLYKGIRMLPAGSTFWIDKAGRREVKKYCKISEILSSPIISDGKIKPAEIQNYLRDVLLDSVKHHMVADVPVGVFLSSGLDSMTLSGLASEVEGKGLRTLTLGFREYQGTERDESPLAELGAQNYRTSHKTCWISKADFEADFVHLFTAMDQPTVDGVNTYFVSKIAAQNGLKVALSGAGGDELFGGYSSFEQLPQLVSFVNRIPFYQRLGAPFRRVSASLLKRFVSPKYAGIFEYGGTYAGAYLLRRSLYMPWELPDILDVDLVREGWRDLQPLMKLEETVSNVESSHMKVAGLEMEWYLRNQLLRDADWAGMAHSLEIRVPFVDVDLLKRLAPLMAGKNPPRKQDMARTPSKELLREVLCRRRTGFSVPVHEWLSQGKESRPADRGLRGWAKTVYKAQGGTIIEDINQRPWR